MTNSWPFSALLDVVPDPEDACAFTLNISGHKKPDALKLRCKYRPYLLSELFRLKAAASGWTPGNSVPDFARAGDGESPNDKIGGTYHCKKLTRRQYMTDCVLEVGADAIVYRKTDGSLLSRYSYTNIEDFTRISDDRHAFVIQYTGRGRLFYCERRDNLMSKVRTAAHILGLSWNHQDSTLDQFKQARAYYGHDLTATGKTLVEFKVKKLTAKHKVCLLSTIC